MAEIKGVRNNKPSRRPKGVRNSERLNGKASKRHPKAFSGITRKLVCIKHGES